MFHRHWMLALFSFKYHRDVLCMYVAFHIWYFSFTGTVYWVLCWCHTVPQLAAVLRLEGGFESTPPRHAVFIFLHHIYILQFNRNTPYFQFDLVSCSVWRTCDMQSAIVFSDWTVSSKVFETESRIGWRQDWEETLVAVRRNP